jgi:uncharacterized protein YodC (DUF2158 family)
MADTLKLGDTVRLRSGGPLMTIAARADHGWQTFWFHDAELKNDVFPEATLEPAKLGMNIFPDAVALHS